MTRYAVILTNDRERDKAHRLVSAAPRFSRVEVKAQKRTTPQNARLWALLTNVSMQAKWHGVKLTPEDWKLIFMAGLKQEMRLVPNLDGTGFVNLGTRSSDLTIEEMGDLMELISAFGSRNGVTFGADE